jgi:antitoxin component YwqK of YwqJK toxin-antitoxin module
MSAEIEIDGGKDASAYKIIVTGKDVDVFIRASQLPEIKGKSGEDIVNFLLKAAKGEITQVTRLKDDVRQDGPNGEPAVECFNMHGQLARVARYKAGVLNDGAKGEAAVKNFYPSDSLVPRLWTILRYKDGKLNDSPDGQPANLQYTEEGVLDTSVRYRNGLRNDGPNGEPAVRISTSAGRLLRTERYKDGHLNDGRNGEPAVQHFDESGTLVRATRFKMNTLVKMLSPTEVADHLTSVKEAEADAAITAANPAMKVRRSAPKL